MKIRNVLLVSMAAMVFGGCGFGRWLGNLFAPLDQSQNVKPDPNVLGVRGHKVAVVFSVPVDVDFEYAGEARRLSTVLVNELEKNVKDIKVVDPARVLRYQAQNVNWDAEQRTKLGKMFEADYLLFISVREFATHDPGMLNICEGRMDGEASFYDCSMEESKACLTRWGDLSIKLPVGSNDEREVRAQTEAEFADLLAKKFYEHKAKVEK